MLSAVAQYLGATIAVLLFDEVEPRTVAWLRVVGAAAALLAVGGRWWTNWTRHQFLSAALFGTVTALMNSARSGTDRSQARTLLWPRAPASRSTLASSR